jgi:purine-nucleoside phosphorylase
MSAILQQLQESKEYIRQQCGLVPKVGLVLGSGLGNLIHEMTIEKEIPYQDIPHFPVSTVEGHSGKLILGTLGGKPVAAMAGRFHYYEGYGAAEVGYPIRVLKWLGVETLVISNAAGGVNPSYRVGDLMIIRDHISLFSHNPLIGKNEPVLGKRFPDMSEPYKKELIHLAESLAKRQGTEVRLGVYCSVTGPSFETHAEYRMLHLLGGDAVGMSTVQEVIVAVHMGLPVFAISVITDIGIRDDNNAITHDEVLKAAQEAEPKLSALVRELIREL